MFTGLAAAVAFRMSLWNVGAEGQLYFGAIGASGIGLWLAGAPTPVLIACMAVAGMLAGAAWALIPALLRAYASTNEIITSLMLNYVAGPVPDVPDLRQQLVLARSLDLLGEDVPAGQEPGRLRELARLGLVRHAVGAARSVRRDRRRDPARRSLRARTRLGFEMQVIGDSPRAARYAGIRTRWVVVLVFCISGACAGLGGASQVGDFQHVLDPRGLQQASFGYTGIVVAALARYNPLGVVIVAVLLGGLQNAGYALQGADFPSGLVGVLQGLILFCALGGELFHRYRVRIARRTEAVPVGEAA